MMLSGAVMEGMQDLLIQYLQLKMAFRVKDQVGGGICGRFPDSLMIPGTLLV